MIKQAARTSAPTWRSSFTAPSAVPPVASRWVSTTGEVMGFSGVSGGTRTTNRRKSSRQPAPRRLALVVIGGLEDGRGQRGLDMQRAAADVRETVLHAGRYDRKLPAFERRMDVAGPHIGLALKHMQHLLDRVQVGRRAVPRLAPLPEQRSEERRVG